MQTEILYILPILASVTALFIKDRKLLNYVSMGFAISILACVLTFLPNFLSENTVITGSLNFRMDGFSYIFVLLVGLAAPLVIWSSFSENHNRSNVYYSLLFIVFFALLAVFTTSNAVQFYIFWELGLIPMYFICGFWGKDLTQKIVNKFFIYTVFGSLLMLGAFIYLYSKMPASQTFSISGLYGLNLSITEQIWIFFAFFVAFAIKIPVFPFHTWQAPTYSSSPMSATMVLAGVMMKMAIYGMLRFLLPICPLALNELGFGLSILTSIGILYASIIAIKQTELKKLFAYMSMAHAGLMVVAIFSANSNAIQGATLQVITHGIIVIALFFIANIYETRLENNEGGGIASIAPRFALMFLLLTLASIALPLTGSFISEFMMLLGIFKTHSVLAIFSASGIILGAVYMLRMYQYKMLGELKNKSLVFKDINLRETLILSIVMLIVVFIGIYPNFLLNISESTINEILNLIIK
ncbi:MAG: NADH-quinone oxidoreductase subunit M [Bacteroidota bacterium]